MRDYYYILGIPPDATEADITAAFRKLSRRFHPDRHNGQRFFEERFKSIVEAYEVLSNVEKRKAYDGQLQRYRSAGMKAGDLRRFEAALERKFQDEFRQREQAVRDAYRVGEQSRGAAAAQKADHPVPVGSQSPVVNGVRQGKKLLMAALAIAIIILAVLLLMRKQRADARGIRAPDSEQPSASREEAPR